jgi:DNA-binding response OmpR family regulator
MQHVLVIDDELDILESIEAVLEIDGYKTSRCSEPLKAIDAIKSIKPDLIILDVMMPMKSGPEILLDLKSHPEIKDIPCILMSAGTSVQYDQEKYGWSIYMKKPFELDDLLDNVKKLI